MKGTKRRQGISLIVLVITIIIMIILATAVILSLSSSDIVDKANTATQRSDFANAKNVAATAYGESMLDGLTGDAEITYVQEKLDASFGTGKYIVGERGQVVPIPAGFTVSRITGETTISGGLVIYEGTEPVTNIDENDNEIIDAQEQRNQFVWVPVEGGWQAGHEWGTGYITLNDITEGTTPPQEQLDSINTYGGFYIARYEAGKPTGSELTGGTTTDLDIDGTDKPVSIKGTAVWNNIPFDSMCAGGASYGDQTNPGCALVASKAYEGSSSVTSSLMYGAQWDAALSFISKTNGTYATNSTGMGWYDQSEPTTTGSNTDYAINNIYDMAGNVYEWTYEAYTDYGYGRRVLRGCSYGDSCNFNPVSFRYYNSPNGYGSSSGFRTLLCLK